MQLEKIAVIFPSRGMSFSRTCEELLRELDGISHRFFFSVGNPLPQCFNIPIEEALKDESFTHFLICEDDMILPKGILRSMLNKSYPVVALDYPFEKDGDATTMRAPDGTALYTGTGFVLVERVILDVMPKPIFSTDTAWDCMITKDDKLIFWPRDVSNIKTYGLHDVHFGLTLWSNDLPIQVMHATAGQRKLGSLGKDGVNKGEHSIYEIRNVWKNNTTKSNNPYIIKGYLERMNRIKTVEILDDKPDYIYYEDGQARVYEEHIIV